MNLVCSFCDKLTCEHVALQECDRGRVVRADMNQDVDYALSSGSSGNGKLRQWLIEQVDCGKYPGLVWENDEKSIFRIPWKHAGKQDYNRDEDAALFKVRDAETPGTHRGHTGAPQDRIKTFRIKQKI